MVDEAIARPILVGRPTALNAIIGDQPVRIRLGEDVDVIKPQAMTNTKSTRATITKSQGEVVFRLKKR